MVSPIVKDITITPTTELQLQNSCNCTCCPLFRRRGFGSPTSEPSPMMMWRRRNVVIKPAAIETAQKARGVALESFATTEKKPSG